MRRTPVIDLRLGSAVERDDVGRMVYAIVAHLATVTDTQVDLFDALDAACHELAGLCSADHQPTWAFWTDADHFGVAASRAPDRVVGEVAAEFPLAGAVGEVTTTSEVVTWQLGGHTAHSPLPPEPSAANDRVRARDDRDDDQDDDRDDHVIRLRVPAALEHGAAVRAIVRSVVDFRDDDEEARYLIAATEVFTRAVRANRRRADPPPVEVDVIGDPARGGGRLTIADRGDGPMPAVLRPADADPGLAIARSLVPDLSHAPVDGGCVVALPFPPERPPRG
jgi:hypothetical protein